MDSIQSADQVKEFLLNYNRVEGDEELSGTSGPCYSLSWKKDSWIIRENTRKIGTIEVKNLPRGFDMRHPDFLKDCLAILRSGQLEGLTKWLKAIKKDRSAGVG